MPIVRTGSWRNKRYPFADVVFIPVPNSPNPFVRANRKESAFAFIRTRETFRYGTYQMVKRSLRSKLLQFAVFDRNINHSQNNRLYAYDSKENEKSKWDREL